MNDIEIGSRCKIVQAQKGSIFSLTKQMEWPEHLYPKKISSKLRKLYPTWGHLINTEGVITDIENLYIGRYLSIVPNRQPDVFFKIHEKWVKILKDSQRLEKISDLKAKCICPVSYLVNYGCKCGGI